MNEKKSSSLLRLLFSWIGWTLIYALILSGRPWPFPQQASELLHTHAQTKKLSSKSRSALRPPPSTPESSS